MTKRNEVTKEQLTKAMEIVILLGQLIREKGSIPSGELYACVCMGRMSLESYDRCIEMLVNSKLVTNKNYLLTWIGPKEVVQ